MNMKTIIAAVALALGFAAPAAAVVIPPTTGYYSISYDRIIGTSTLQLAGDICVSASSKTLSTCVIRLSASSSGMEGSTLTVSGGKVSISTPIGNGNLRVRAGNGNGGGTAPIVLYSHAASSTTGNTSATAWIIADQFTIPANSLVNDGDAIEVFCVAKATSTNLTKGIETTINGTQTSNGATADTGARWTGLTTIRRTSATTADVYSERHRATGFVSDAIYALSVTFANAFDVTCDIRASATAYPSAAGDENMDLKYMRVLLYPAP